MIENKHPLISLITASELFLRCFNDKHELIVQPPVADMRKLDFENQLNRTRNTLAVHVVFDRLVHQVISSIDEALEVLNGR